MSDTIRPPLEGPAVNLGELLRAAGESRSALQSQGLLATPANTSTEAAEVIRRKFPNATEEQIDALAPKIQRILPQIREKVSKREIPVTPIGTPNFAQNQAIPVTADRNDLAPNFGPDTTPAELLTLLGGVVAPALLPSTAGAGALMLASGLGAAAGETAFQAISPDPDATLRDKGEEVLKAAAFEVLGQKVVQGLGIPFRLLRGNRQVAEQSKAALERFGIKPSLQDISTTPAVGGIKRILGPFPLLNSRFKRRLNETKELFDKEVDRRIAEVSPDTLEMRRLLEIDPAGAAAINRRISEGGLEALGDGFEVMRRTRTQKWVEMGQYAKRLEAQGTRLRSPMSMTALRFKQAEEQLFESGIIDEAGRVLKSARGGDSLGQIATFLKNLGDEPLDGSFSSLIARKRRLSAKIDDFQDNPTVVNLLNDIKLGIDEDIKALSRLDPTLKGMYDDANAVSEEFFTLLGELVGRRTRQFQRGGGRQAFQSVDSDAGTLLKGAGTRDPIEIIDLLARNGTPKELSQVFSVISRARGEAGARKVFGDVLGRKLSKALDGSIREAIEKGADPNYAPQNFRKLMSLEDPGSKEFAATMELFKRTGISPRQAQDIGDVMQILFGVKNPKVSDFVARRGVLGGAGSLLSGVTGGLVGGSAASGATLGPVMFLLLGRSIGKWATSPARAKLVLQVANASEQSSFRSRALVSLLTDETLWAGESTEERRLRQEAIEAQSTRSGRQQFFEDLDNEYDLSRVGKRRRRQNE